MNSSAFVIVNTTIDGIDPAKKLAQLIVKEKLAACVQYAPINSVYRWKGKIEAGEEFILSIKTKDSLADKLVAFIKKNHSYEVPEIIVTPIIGGHKDYLNWIDEETQ